MSDDSAFEITEDLLPAADPPPEAAAPPPRVIVQYRSRGFPSALIPPMLILIATVAIMSYQRQTPIRSVVASTPRPAPAPNPAPEVKSEPIAARADSVPARVADSPPPSFPSAPEPPVVATAPAPVARPPAIDDPSELFEIGSDQGLKRIETAALLPRPELDRPAIGFDRPADPAPESGPAPQPQPPPQPKLEVATKEEVLQDIQREAEQKQAEQEKLEIVKEHSKELEILEAIQKAQEKRVTFHQELREIVKTPGNKTGAKIEDLCVAYGREIKQEIREEVKRMRRRTSGRGVTPAVMIERMRVMGVPEPAILDFLANDLHAKTMNTRNGPRSVAEIRYLAALQLLSLPVSSVESTNPAPRAFANTTPNPAPRRPQ